MKMNGGKRGKGTVDANSPPGKTNNKEGRGK
jgi:hypothetical protein